MLYKAGWDEKPLILKLFKMKETLADIKQQTTNLLMGRCTIFSALHISIERLLLSARSLTPPPMFPHELNLIVESVVNLRIQNNRVEALESDKKPFSQI